MQVYCVLHWQEREAYHSLLSPHSLDSHATAPTYDHLTAPADRRAASPWSSGKLRGAGPAHHSLHRGRWHRARHLARVPARLRRRGAEGLRGQAGRSCGSRCWPARRRETSSTAWLPEDTLRAIDHYLVAIKGPLTTPVGGGFRSLNVALRQKLDLYACVRPVRWFTGVPSPGQAAGAGGHDHLPGEHRGHLRRHRIQGAERAGGKRIVQFPPAGAGGHDHPVSRDQRHRDQADLGRGQQATDPGGARLRGAREAEERHAGPQGQHHEVHRGRLPGLGLRAGPAGVRRGGARRRSLVPAAAAAS